MLNIHAEALNSEMPAYHKFLLRYQANKNVVYGIVEGKEDPVFYTGMIEANLPNDWSIDLVPAGRKANVLAVMSKMDWQRFSSKRVCFFVDRDLSLFINEEVPEAENLYVTQNYSIENYAVTFAMAKRIITEVLNIEMTKDEEDHVKKLYESSLATFTSIMVPVMTQIIDWRRKGHRPKLNNIAPNSIFEFGDGVLRLRNGLDTLQAIIHHVSNCVHLPPSPPEVLSNGQEEFLANDGEKRYIRGKYMLWFLVSFTLALHESVSLLISRYSKAPKVHVNFGYGNAVYFLAPRVRCPEPLKEFINRNYIEWIMRPQVKHSS